MMVALIVRVYSDINSLGGPSPREVAAVAHSKKVTDADTRATRALESQLSALLRLRPWLNPQAARYVIDGCVGDTGIGCSRTVRGFAAFDGDFVARNREIETDLVAAGWRGESYDDIPYLVGNYYHPPYGANDLRAASYTLLRQAPPPVVYFGTELVVWWAERPVGGVQETRLTDSGRPSKGSLREYRPIDTRTVLADGLRDHQYVIVFTLSGSYFQKLS